MPICKECNNAFPNRLFQNEKWLDLRTRKYCLTCSPFGTRRKCGPKPKQVGSRECIECGREHTAKKNRVCSSCRTHKQRHDKKLKAIEYKGGKCQTCGYNKCKNALVFHHRDPKEKEFNLSWFWSNSWESLQEELNKCDLLCSNCHQEFHDTGERRPTRQSQQT